MRFEITQAHAVDAQEIINVANIIAGETDNLSFGAGDFPYPTAEAEGVFIENQIKAGGFMLLARCAEKLVGSISVGVGNRERTRHYASLGMSVLKQYWGQGIGAALLDAAILRLEKDPLIEVLSLHVRCDNKRAIGLYKSRDFEITGTDPAFLKINDELVDAYIMSRRIMHE